MAPVSYGYHEFDEEPAYIPAYKPEPCVCGAKLNRKLEDKDGVKHIRAQCFGCGKWICTLNEAYGSMPIGLVPTFMLEGKQYYKRSEESALACMDCDKKYREDYKIVW